MTILLFDSRQWCKKNAQFILDSSVSDCKKNCFLDFAQLFNIFYLAAPCDDAYGVIIVACFLCMDLYIGSWHHISLLCDSLTWHAKSINSS